MTFAIKKYMVILSPNYINMVYVAQIYDYNATILVAYKNSSCGNYVANKLPPTT
jgi:hypothetical protein